MGKSCQAGADEWQPGDAAHPGRRLVIDTRRRVVFGRNNFCRIVKQWEQMRCNFIGIQLIAVSVFGWQSSKVRKWDIRTRRTSSKALYSRRLAAVVVIVLVFVRLFYKFENVESRSGRTTIENL